MDRTEQNPGWAAGIGQRSRVQQLAWAVTGAPMRTKDLRLNAISAIAEGRKLRNRITALMEKAEADPADARVYCVFSVRDAFVEPDPISDPDLAALDVVHTPKTARLRVANDANDLELINEHANMVPTGFLIFVWDRNARARKDSEGIVVWTIRPLIVEGRPGTTATAVNAAAMREEKKRIEKKLKINSGIYPDDKD